MLINHVWNYRQDNIYVKNPDYLKIYQKLPKNYSNVSALGSAYGVSLAFVSVSFYFSFSFSSFGYSLFFELKKLSRCFILIIRKWRKEPLLLKSN